MRLNLYPYFIKNEKKFSYKRDEKSIMKSHGELDENLTMKYHNKDTISGVRIVEIESKSKR